MSVSSWLILGSLLTGIALALARPGRLAVPRPVNVAAQAVIGATVGGYVQASSLEAVAADWPVVALVSAGTLAASLGAGLALARLAPVDRATASLGMVAGGATGMVAMAGDLGADDRLVAFMQYLRIVVIVALTPVLAALAFAPGPGGPGAALPGGPVAGAARDWAVTLAVCAAGVALARRAAAPAGTLLAPMALAAAVTLLAPRGWFVVPPLLRDAAFVAVGLDVGLRFTLGTLRQIGRLLVPVLLAVLGLMAVCALLAAGLAATTPATLLDAYLATTPGGLPAVLAVAVGSGADSTFVLAVQSLRLLLMVAVAPFAVRAFAARGR